MPMSLVEMMPKKSQDCHEREERPCPHACMNTTQFGGSVQKVPEMDGCSPALYDKKRLCEVFQQRDVPSRMSSAMPCSRPMSPIYACATHALFQTIAFSVLPCLFDALPCRAAAPRWHGVAPCPVS